MINMVEIVHIFGALRAHIVMFCADLFVSTILHLSAFNRSLHFLFLKIGAHGVIPALICTNLRPLNCTRSLPRASPLDPHGVITLLENGPHFMSNKVEIVKIIGARRARDLRRCFICINVV